MRPKASHTQQKAASAEINKIKSKPHQAQKKASPVVETEKLPGARNAAGKKRQLPETMGDSDDQSDTSDAAWIAPTNEDSDDDDNESRQEDLEIDFTRENVEEAEDSDSGEESEEEDEGDIPLEEKVSEIESGGLDNVKEDNVGKPNIEKIEDPMSALMAQRIAEKRKARQVSSSRSSCVASISQKQPINIVGEI